MQVGASGCTVWYIGRGTARSRVLFKGSLLYETGSRMAFGRRDGVVIAAFETHSALMASEYRVPHTSVRDNLCPDSQYAVS